jgi:hypothetical protein
MIFDRVLDWSRRGVEIELLTVDNHADQFWQHYSFGRVQERPFGQRGPHEGSAPGVAHERGWGVPGARLGLRDALLPQGQLPREGS